MNAKLKKLKKRLYSFEVTFCKHAEVCFSCHSLNIWAMGEAMPERCHRCDKQLPRVVDEDEVDTPHD